MLDIARPSPRGPHDLHRSCSRRGLHRAHVDHDCTLRAPISAQLSTYRRTKPLISGVSPNPKRIRVLSRGWAGGLPGKLSPSALVAQGIEHGSPKAGVAGSNPAGGTPVFAGERCFAS